MQVLRPWYCVLFTLCNSFPPKIWFVKISTRILKYKWHALKTNPVKPISCGVSCSEANQIISDLSRAILFCLWLPNELAWWYLKKLSSTQATVLNVFLHDTYYFCPDCQDPDFCPDLPKNLLWYKVFKNDSLLLMKLQAHLSVPKIMNFFTSFLKNSDCKFQTILNLSFKKYLSMHLLVYIAV